MKLLTKSRYISGLQCHKLLWYLVNQKDLIPELDESTLSRMNEGTKVGELATKLFPDGLIIPDKQFMRNIELTKTLLKTKKPLFEAGFMINNLYSRVDILKPNDDGTYDIIEVKSSTKVKPENIHDVSFQKHTLELSGLKIKNCILCHINTSYIRQGELDINQLFTLSDITEQVIEAQVDIEERIQEMKDIINQPQAPKTPIGIHCNSPYSCSLQEMCWKEVPEDNVFNLYRGGKRAQELFNNNIIEIKEIPESTKLNAKQLIQRNAAITNKPHIQSVEIKQFIDTLHYPIYHFDFETIAPTIPQFDNMRPYQRLAFQYSLHIEQEDGSIEHKSFLADGKGDCRQQLIDAMQEDLDDWGSILVYYAPFEKGVIKELIRDFPEIEEWANKILQRIEDLHDPFKNFHYYNPSQQGSASIKAILPALTDLSYKELDIQNGEVASRLFAQTMFGNLSQEEIEKIRNDLEEYCKLDTWAEVVILRELKKLV